MSGTGEAERNRRIDKALADAEAAAGNDIAALFKEFHAKFFEQESATRTLRAARSNSPTRSTSSPLRLARLNTESQMFQDPRYVKNAKALWRRKTSISAKRIIGGIAVSDPEFLDCVAVRDAKEWKCSGTLIASNAVLTAGHCTCEDKDSNPTHVFLEIMWMARARFTVLIGSSGNQTMRNFLTR